MKVLDVDLTTGEVSPYTFDEATTRAYLGGGVAARYLMDTTTPDLDPLDPASRLCIIAGLLVGTGAPSACKLSVYARSPLTGIWGESTMGGHFPARLRYTGYDGLILRGRAEKPVTLLMTEEGLSIEDAGELWGKDCFETAGILEERHGKKCGVACIGPAGERQLPFAALVGDGRVARVAGRGGMGAVLGSKNVKAIVAIGARQPEVADPEGLKEHARQDAKTIAENAARIRPYGTSGGVEAREMIGDLPIKNWELGRWKDGAKKTTAQSYFDDYLEKHHTCDRCPIRCGKLLRQKHGQYTGSVSHGPEYETSAGFGSNCLIDDPVAIMTANEYCNRVGMDTITASGIAGFAMEAYERGLITKDDTGYEVSWGSGEVLMRIMEDVVEGRGIGKLLAGGVRAAAKQLGPEAEAFAVHVKGMELPMHDPRAFTSMVISYGIGARGGCHLDSMTYMREAGLVQEGFSYPEEVDPHSSTDHKVELGCDHLMYYGLFNPLGLCKFASIGKAGPAMITRWVQLVTGWDVTAEELLESAERLLDLKRLYNLQRGMEPAEDRMPARVMQPRPDGGSGGVVPDENLILAGAYNYLGWDADGVPEKETLARLGLSV